MIAETMAGIALVKASVDGIKKAITTCNDIGDIAKYIDGMFDGEQQIQKKRSKAQKDPFAINSIAEETINAIQKLNQSLTEHDHSIYRQLYSAIDDLEGLSRFDKKLSHFLEILKQSSVSIQESSSGLIEYLDQIEGSLSI